MTEKFAALVSTLILVLSFIAMPCCGMAIQEQPKPASEKQETVKPDKPAADVTRAGDEPDKKAKANKNDKSNSAAAKASSGDWPLFRGNSKSTGVAKSELPDKPDVLWKFEVKKGSFESAPVVINSGGKKTVYIGDLDGTLLAIDLESGKPAWKFKSASVRESEAKGKSHGGIGFETAAAYRDGRFYIGDLDGIFYCFDAKGKEVWQFQTESGGVIHSSANFHKDLVLFGSEDSKLYALNAKTGKKAWELETGDQVRCSMTVVDGRAFVAGCDGSLHTINLDEGKEESSVAIESPTGVTPAVVGDTVYVGSEQAGFFAIDWKKAEIKWHFNPENSVVTRSSPAVNKDHVIFGSRGRVVYSLDPSTGKLNWSTTLKANIDSSPVIAGERVFVGSNDGRMYGINLKNGDVIWQKQLQGSIIGSPAVAFNRLIIATDRGVVYCLGKEE